MVQQFLVLKKEKTLKYKKKFITKKFITKKFEKNSHEIIAGHTRQQLRPFDTVPTSKTKKLSQVKLSLNGVVLKLYSASKGRNLFRDVAMLKNCHEPSSANSTRTTDTAG